MAGNSDMKAHEATYHSIIGLMKYGSIAVAAIALFIIILIAK